MPREQERARLRERLSGLFGAIVTTLSPNRSDRAYGADVRAAVIHTTESGPGSLRAVVNYFQNAGTDVSAHYVVGDMPPMGAVFCPVVMCVPEDEKAWTARSANSVTVNYELIGRASRPRADWVGPYRAQLETVAALVAEDVFQYDIPVVRAFPGILGHGDLARYGFPNNHTDPGAGFPWDVFLALVDKYGEQGDVPDVGVVRVPSRTDRPADAPEKIPAWAWELMVWHDSARRGPRPTKAPRSVPQWYWAWRAWRLGLRQH